MEAPADRELLSVEDLHVDYRRRFRLGSKTPTDNRAVDGVSFTIERGRTMALVGESGSGKTSVARAILGIAPITAGRVLLAGHELATPSRHPTRADRRNVQMVFQQPTASLDPRMLVGDSIAEPLVHLLGLRGHSLRSRVGDLLELVGLERAHADRYPRHLSGGQRQRVAIARAIGPNPRLVICDEPTSSLDVSVQAQIINLLTRLQTELGLSYLFISHDLGVVRQVADDIAVMLKGRIVQAGPADDVLRNPHHEYARALIAAVPRLRVEVAQDQAGGSA